MASNATVFQAFQGIYHHIQFEYSFIILTIEYSLLIYFVPTLKVNPGAF